MEKKSNTMKKTDTKPVCFNLFDGTDVITLEVKMSKNGEDYTLKGLNTLCIVLSDAYNFNRSRGYKVTAYEDECLFSSVRCRLEATGFYDVLQDELK